MSAHSYAMEQNQAYDAVARCPESRGPTHGGTLVTSYVDDMSTTCARRSGQRMGEPQVQPRGVHQAQGCQDVLQTRQDEVPANSGALVPYRGVSIDPEFSGAGMVTSTPKKHRLGPLGLGACLLPPPSSGDEEDDDM